jgi:hypothetical protein
VNLEAASVVARRIAAVPARTSSETWLAIVDLLSPAGSPAYRDLTAITSIAAILISEEYTREAPVVVMPARGPRIRIQTVHGMEAIEHIGEETPLHGERLTEAGWSMSLPCGAADLEEITAALADSPAVTVRDISDGITVQARAAAEPGITAGLTASPVIDLKEMRRP